MSTPSTYLSPSLSAPTFSPTTYTNTLILSTNNPSDTPLDLSTPLSRVLFDVQEVDTHIDSLTTHSALPIIQHTSSQNSAAQQILSSVEEQVETLQTSFARLRKEVTERYEEAEEVRLCSENLVKTLRLGRAVQRVVGLGRNLQARMDEVVVVGHQNNHNSQGYRSMVPAARAVLEMKECFMGTEGALLGKVAVAASVRQDVGSALERTLVERCRGVVREFSMSGVSSSASASTSASTTTTTTTTSTSSLAGQEKTFAQMEETKKKAEASLQTLYLLSPPPVVRSGHQNATDIMFEPTLMIQALKNYIDSALTSSLASLSRALATLPMLDRTLLEISARCQNILALESLLETVKPPIINIHPSLSSSTKKDTATDTGNLLQPLLRHLETSSLPSYFWRTMASQLTARVQDILSRGGVSARTLRSNRNHVRDAIRECVDRGYRGKFMGKGQVVEKGNWEREAAVMVGSVIGPLGR